MLVNNVADYQSQFSKWWVQEWKAVPFPERVSSMDFSNRFWIFTQTSESGIVTSWYQLFP